MSWGRLVGLGHLARGAARGSFLGFPPGEEAISGGVVALGVGSDLLAGAALGFEHGAGAGSGLGALGLAALGGGAPYAPVVGFPWAKSVGEPCARVAYPGGS